MEFASRRGALMAAVAAAAPFLLARACAATCAQRGRIAVGGEFGVLAPPLAVGTFAYGSEED